MKYVVAIILGVVVLASLVYLMVGTENSKRIDVVAKFQEGCQILSRNGCNMDFYIYDEKKFEEFLKENGYNIEKVKEQCCVEYK